MATINPLPEVEPNDQIDVVFFNSLIGTINQLITEKEGLLIKYGTFDFSNFTTSASTAFGTTVYEASQSISFGETFKTKSNGNPDGIVMAFANVTNPLIATASARDMTTTGFTLRASTTYNYSSAGATMRVSWLAIGQRA